MIKETIFHISYLKNNTCFSTGIKYDTDVDPLIFLLNFHKFCEDNTDFKYLTFHDLLDELYISDYVEFYEQLENTPDCISSPLGYDSRATICGFQYSIGEIDNIVDLTSSEFTPIPSTLLNDQYYLSTYLYEDKGLDGDVYMYFSRKYVDGNCSKTERIPGDIGKIIREFSAKHYSELSNLPNGIHEFMGETFEKGFLITDVNIIKAKHKLSEY